jgi:hypothetical protein
VGHPSPHIVFHILIRQLCHYCICILQPMIQTLLHLIIHRKLSNCFTVSIHSNSRKAPTWNHQMMLRKASINSQAHVGNYMYQN